MARILAIDWDGVEARFALGTVRKNRLIVLKAGSAPIFDAAAEIAEAVGDESDEKAASTDECGASTDENGEGLAPSLAESDATGDVKDGAVETVETSTVSGTDFDEDEESEATDAPDVVSTVKKSKKGESFKNSPLAKTLKNLLRERRVGSALVCCVLERGDVDVLYMSIPFANDAETPELVRNQALRESLTFNETQPIDYLPLNAAASRTGSRPVVAVSIPRDKLRRVRETAIGAIRAPSKIELREPALAEFLRAEFCGLNFNEPVVLIQELCDETNLTLCDVDGTVLYFRSFKIQPDAEPAVRAERIRDEIVRTIAAGSGELAEDVVVRKALLFSNDKNVASLKRSEIAGDFAEKSEENADKSASGETSVAADSREFDEKIELQTTGTQLAKALLAEEIELEFANPFRLPGVELRSMEPDNPGRFASVLGSILAERPQNRPAIDLLHPREKPKPPNYALYVVAFLFVAIVALGSVWFWNKNELKRLQTDLTELAKKRDQVALELNAKRPLYNVLSTANRWQNVQGAIVLDELRDIALRIPKAPDLVATRLAYLGTWSDGPVAYRGRPVFIIQAKISSIEVYQQFRAALTADRSHFVLSQNGPLPNVGGGGYRYLFEAYIVCYRRNPQTFVAKLPTELQSISNNLPEYFLEQRKQRQEEAKRLEEERLKKAAEAQAERLRLQEEQRKQAEAAAANGSATQNRPTEADLLRRRAELDNYMRQVQASFQAGKTTQEELQKITAQYRTEVAKVVQLWNALQQEKAQNPQSAAQPEASSPQSESQPASQPETPPSPQPEAPASQPETPPSSQPEAPAAQPETPPSPQPEAPASQPETPPSPQPEAPASQPETPPSPQPEAPASQPETPPSPQPEAPASQPETPPSPQPEAQPAPSAPETPASNSAWQRSQTDWTEA